MSKSLPDTREMIAELIATPSVSCVHAELDMSNRGVIDKIAGWMFLHKVSPDDKLRLVQLMQGQGMIVAMTGDAVNDAAALKQADIGVAMGSGSEVTKQAAKMILTDDNFGTLVHAVELGRSIYQKIKLYVRYQMSQLLALVILFLTASLFNIAGGVAMTPIMVLFLNFLVASGPVVVIMLEPVDPGIMQRPPRDPSIPLTNRSEVIRWLTYGTTLFFVTLIPLVWGPDTPSPTEASASMTMAFAVMAFGTLFTGLAVRRDPESGLGSPRLRALGILAIPAALTVLATQWTVLQEFVGTQPLKGSQWVISFLLASVVLVVVESEKWVRRRRSSSSCASDTSRAPASSVAKCEKRGALKWRARRLRMPPGVMLPMCPASGAGGDSTKPR